MDSTKKNETTRSPIAIEKLLNIIEEILISRSRMGTQDNMERLAILKSSAEGKVPGINQEAVRSEIDQFFLDIFSKLFNKKNAQGKLDNLYQAIREDHNGSRVNLFILKTLGRNDVAHKALIEYLDGLFVSDQLHAEEFIISSLMDPNKKLFPLGFEEVVSIFDEAPLCVKVAKLLIDKIETYPDLFEKVFAELSKREYEECSDESGVTEVAFARQSETLISEIIKQIKHECHFNEHMRPVFKFLFDLMQAGSLKESSGGGFIVSGHDSKKLKLNFMNLLKSVLESADKQDPKFKFILKLIKDQKTKRDDPKEGRVLNLDAFFGFEFLSQTLQQIANENPQNKSNGLLHRWLIAVIRAVRYIYTDPKIIKSKEHGSSAVSAPVPEFLRDVMGYKDFTQKVKDFIDHCVENAPTFKKASAEMPVSAENALLIEKIHHFMLLAQFQSLIDLAKKKIESGYVQSLVTESMLKKVSLLDEDTSFKAAIREFITTLQSNWDALAKVLDQPCQKAVKSQNQLSVGKLGEEKKQQETHVVALIKKLEALVREIESDRPRSLIFSGGTGHRRIGSFFDTTASASNVASGVATPASASSSHPQQQKSDRTQSLAPLPLPPSQKNATAVPAAANKKTIGTSSRPRATSHTAAATPANSKRNFFKRVDKNTAHQDGKGPNDNDQSPNSLSGGK